MVARLVGAASVCVGLGLAIPALTAWREQGAMPLLGWAMLVPGGMLLAGGGCQIVRGLRGSGSPPVPASVLGPILVNALFLGLLALEISDALARRGGVPLSLFVFPPALALFGGLLTGRSWAWYAVRWASLGGTLFYVGISIVACVARPEDQHGPVWIWLASVGFALGSLLFTAGFHALGRPSARQHFGVLPATTAG